MADSKRLTVLKSLTTLLETITVANGYQHTLTGAVFRGRLKYDDNAPLPMLSIIEYPQVEYTAKFVGSGQKKYKHGWDLMIQGWAEGTGQHPTDKAHLLLADVQKALAAIGNDGGAQAPGASFMLGGLISQIEMTPGLVRPADENSSVPCFYLRVKVEVAENPSDPYSLS